MSDDARFNPFFDFINTNLDMDGVDGICFETVALAMREVIKSLPSDPNGEMWSDRLNHLQEVLRLCLSIETIGRLVQDNPRFAHVDPRDLDIIVNLSMTLAFICYNDIGERFGFEDEKTVKTRRTNVMLWKMLRSAQGWVNKAASEGDAVAEKFGFEIARLLEDTRPENYNNNTRTLSAD